MTRYLQKYFQICALYKSGPQKQSFTRVKSGFKVFILFVCNDKFCKSRLFVLLSNKEGMGPMKVISIFITFVHVTTTAEFYRAFPELFVETLFKYISKALTEINLFLRNVEWFKQGNWRTD